MKTFTGTTETTETAHKSTERLTTMTDNDKKREGSTGLMHNSVVNTYTLGKLKVGMFAILQLSGETVTSNHSFLLIECK